MLPPYLTDAEIAEICRPRTQGAAQIRYLRSLGLRVERRARCERVMATLKVERKGLPAAQAA